MLHKILNISNPLGVMGLNQRNIELIYAHNKRENYRLADDKVLTKEVLHQNGIACAETFAVIRKMSDIKKKWQDCRHYHAMAIKPANGCGGDGIKILKKNDAGQWCSGGKPQSEAAVFQHIACIISGMFSMNSNDSCLIEAYIVPHPFFAEIYNEGVPDFRIITLKEKPLIGMLRMPTSKSGGKANLHQKGVGIGIDMDRGVLTQVYDGKRYLTHHPDNPMSIVGKPIPHWDAMIALSIKTAKAFPLDYLGIDLVIDKNRGPQIMEVNVRPGLGIQLVNKCGMVKAIEKAGRTHQKG